MGKKKRSNNRTREATRRAVVRDQITRPARQYTRLTRSSFVPIFAPKQAFMDMPAVRPVWLAPPMRQARTPEVQAPKSAPLFRPWSEVPTRKSVLASSPCVSRKRRRAVIFAKSLLNKGSASRSRKFTDTSKEHC